MLTRCRCVAFLTLFGLTLTACGSETLQVNVIFRDAEGLQRGHSVVYHGVVVGEVEKVELLPDDRVAVRLSFDPHHRDRVREGVRFDIKRPWPATTSGERFVDMKVPDASTPALPDGATVEGYAGTWEQILEDMEQLGEKAGEKAAEGALELLQEAREMLADSTATADSADASRRY